VVFSAGTPAGADTVFESFMATTREKASLMGFYAGGQFGSDIATGDFNNDGIDDLAVGAPYASLSGKKWNGAVNVYFGQSKSSSSYSSFRFSPDLTFFGATTDEHLGMSLVSGDFDGNGTEDLAIGAYKGILGTTHVGRVDVLMGLADYQSDFIDISEAEDSLSFVGKSQAEGFGLVLEVGDLNNDGDDDLVVGTPFANNGKLVQSGRLNVYFGGESNFKPRKYPRQVDKADISILGEVSGSRLGGSIAVGDFNGDGFNDLSVGAYSYEGEKSGQVGKVYVYNGRSGWTNPGQEILGNDINGLFGFSMASGDVDSNGYDDLVVNSFPYPKKSSGESKFYYGGADFFEENKSATNWTYLSEGNIFGAFAKIVDLDGDGKRDLVFGAPGVGDPVSEQEGNVYIKYGNGEVAVISGENANDWFGFKFESLDFNDDAFLDLAVTSQYSDTPYGVNAGKVFVVFGDGAVWGEEREVISGDFISRGEMIGMIFDTLKLADVRSEDIRKCEEFIEFCLFNFSAVSSFDGITFEPNVILYPDVRPGDDFYEEINMATMLGLINGYISDDQTPFKANGNISRIQALKVLLGSGDLVEPRYRFELVKELGSELALRNQESYFSDIDGRISHMWWYPRYANYAYENGVIEKDQKFRPDEYITKQEFELWLGKINNLLGYNEETDSRGDSEQETVGAGSEEEEA